MMALMVWTQPLDCQNFRGCIKQLIAMACIYLASKIEERNMIKLTHIVTQYLVMTGQLPAEQDAKQLDVSV